MNNVVIANGHLAKTMQARAQISASQFQLPLGRRLWQGQAGEFAGSGVGSSLDFQDHRTYVPGDDLRHINWQAYARSGNYTMKLYHQEVRPYVDVIFDVSESMFFEEAKAGRSLELFYFTLESAWRLGASLRIYVVRGSDHCLLAEESVLSHAWLNEFSWINNEKAESVPFIEQLPLRARSLCVFISDLLFPGEPDSLFSVLNRRGRQSVIYAPFTQSESAPSWNGNYEFVDAEKKTRHPHRVETKVLEKYQYAYTKHFAMWKRWVRKHHALMARIPAELPFAEAACAEAVKLGAMVL